MQNGKEKYTVEVVKAKNTLVWLKLQDMVQDHGLGGWNCRHSMFPFFEDISNRAYTDKELEELKSEDKSSIILTEKEKNVIKNYTGFDATKINKAIRLNNITSDIQNKIDIIDSVIQKAEPLLNEINVYRGTIIQSLKGFENNKNVDQSIILGLKNQIISDRAFVSTSKIKAEDQGRNIIMSIKLPKGYKGAIEIKDYATEKYKYQDEVLLKRNTKFFVNNIIYKDGKYYFDMEALE